MIVTRCDKEVMVKLKIGCIDNVELSNKCDLVRLDRLCAVQLTFTSPS